MEDDNNNNIIIINNNKKMDDNNNHNHNHNRNRNHNNKHKHKHKYDHHLHLFVSRVLSNSRSGKKTGGKNIYIYNRLAFWGDAKMTMPQVDGKKCSTRKTMLFELGSTPWKLQMLGVAVSTKNDVRWWDEFGRFEAV